jgi:hypothetical protein
MHVPRVFGINMVVCNEFRSVAHVRLLYRCGHRSVVPPENFVSCMPERFLFADKADL